VSIRLARFALDDGGSVIVEVDSGPAVARASRTERVIQQARLSFDQALGEVRAAADAALAQLRGLAQRPSEVEIVFGVQLDAEAGAVIAKTAVQGHLQVTIRWQDPGGSAAERAALG